MKTTTYVKAAIAALMLVGGALAAQPAAAAIFHDAAGRAYYYNNWGQPVYYDTGYDTSYRYYYPDSTTSETTYISSQAPVASSTCREFQRSERGGNSYEMRTGTECLQSDGTWSEE